MSKKILGFNKQQKGKGIKLVPKQMLRKLPISFAYSLYQEKKVTKKYITISWVQ